MPVFASTQQTKVKPKTNVQAETFTKVTMEMLNDHTNQTLTTVETLEDGRMQVAVCRLTTVPQVPSFVRKSTMQGVEIGYSVSPLGQGRYLNLCVANFKDHSLRTILMHPFWVNVECEERFVGVDCM
jgi:hypothetical protein